MKRYSHLIKKLIKLHDASHNNALQVHHVMLTCKSRSCDENGVQLLRVSSFLDFKIKIIVQVRVRPRAM